MGRLRHHLLLSHIVLILLVILAMGVALIYLLESRVVLVNLSFQLSRQAELLADFSADYPGIWQDPEQAAQFVSRFRQRMTAQMMVVAADGTLLASSDPLDEALLGQPLPNVDRATLQRGESVLRTEYSQNLAAEVSDIWAPAFGPDGTYLGAIRLTHQLATVRERFERVRTLIMDILAVGLLLGTVVGFLLALTLEQPIGNLTRAMQRLAGGDVLQRVPEQGPVELRAQAAAFNSLLEHLELLRQARRQLLANVVHELGRPLGALRSASQALLSGADEEPELRTALLTGIDAELGTLERVLDDLTRFSHRDVGPAELSLQPVPLTGWLPSLLGHWRVEASTNDLQWQEQIPAGLPTITADPDRLGQALGNLLSNAIKFTPPGGTVTVSAGTNDDEVWLAVEDSGPGVAAADRQRIFDSFFRSKSQNPLPEGLGLGLTIARDLVEAHGGRLQLASEPGSGSRFTIRLPL